VVLEIAVRHQSHRVKVGSEDVSILVNRTILNDGFSALPDLKNLTETAVEEVYLKVERPSFHLMVKIVKIRVVYNVFKMRLPLEMFRQKPCQCSLSRTDISGNCYVHSGCFKVKIRNSLARKNR